MIMMPTTTTAMMMLMMMMLRMMMIIRKWNTTNLARVRSLKGNLGPSHWFNDRETARSTRQGRRLRFPRNDRTEEVDNGSVFFFLISACACKRSLEVRFSRKKYRYLMLVFFFRLLKGKLNLVAIFCFRPWDRSLHSLTTKDRRRVENNS